MSNNEDDDLEEVVDLGNNSAKAAVSPPAAVAATTRKRSPQFTGNKDLMVAKAWILASMNSVCGRQQKLNTFQIQLSNVYKEIKKELEIEEQVEAKRSSHLQTGPPPILISYPDR